MSRSSPPPRSWDPLAYYSAYRGPVFREDGKFQRFARRLDTAHLRDGYWRFSTEDDEHNAYKYGFNSPEAVLIAQDAGDGAFHDVVLRWVPGELEKSIKPLVGTAAAHLETIYSERKLLGKPLAFHGHVPLYLVSTDPILIHHRLVRYGIQKGVQPDSALLATCRRPSLHEPVPVTPRDDESRTVSSLGHVTTHLPNKQLPKVDHLLTPQAQKYTNAVATSNVDSTEWSLHGISITEPLGVETLTHDSEEIRTDILDEHDRLHAPLIETNICKGSPLVSPDTLNVSQRSVHGKRRELRRPDAESTIYEPNIIEISKTNNAVWRDLIDHALIAPSSNPTPYELHEARCASLPCMDCGSVGSHTSDCWIYKSFQSVKPLDQLNTVDLCSLVASVTRFDPGQWTTNLGPLFGGEEDLQTQMGGITGIIRKCEKSADDPDLQTSDASNLSIEPSDNYNLEMPDTW